MADVDLLQSGQVRIFIQEDGVSPANPYNYYGCMSLDGPSQDLGTPDPVYCPSTSQRNKWEIVDNVPKTQALGTSDFTQHMDRLLRDAWWKVKDKGCKFNMQAVISACDRPDDFSQWQAKILFRGVRLTNFALGAMNVLSGDDNAVVDITGSFIFDTWGKIVGLSFGEVAGAIVVAEALDGIYSDVISCGDCGAASDGCQKVYWLTRSNPGSPGNSSQIVYSLDGGSTWATLDINALGGLSGNRIAEVAGRLVVVSQAYGGHLHELISEIDAGVVGWTGVTTGYVAGKSPRAIYSKSSLLTYVAAQGGYIYLMDDPTAGVTTLSDGTTSTQDLNDIHGAGQTIVAVGNSNAIQKSDNGGESWSLVVGPTPAVSLTAVWCMSSTVWFVGTGNGKLYRTTNSGTTWTQITFGAGATVVNDIKFADDTVGYMAAEVGGVGRIYRTTDSGASWSYQAPSMTGVPAALRYNAVAPCGDNALSAGGIQSAGTDGIIIVGA